MAAGFSIWDIVESCAGIDGWCDFAEKMDLEELEADIMRVQLVQASLSKAKSARPGKSSSR